MIFERGSEWRKWDLHVHTKGTNKNDQFTSITFDDFCNVMFRKALENNIAVIGITDYFSIENYKKIVLYIQNLGSNLLFSEEEKEQIKQIMLIPNVELRMLPSTGSGRLINIHCLFNPDYISKLDNDFFGAIEFSHGTRKYRMNKDDFVNLGKAMGETEDEPAHKKGIDNFVVSHSQLQKILAENTEFRNNTIIVTSNKSTDGASGVQQHFDLFENEQDSSLDATRQAIYKLTDMIFSSNKSDIEYFLGLKKNSKEDVIKKCGSLKPCIHGSDAHTEEKLFTPDNNRYCWIKAEPTFEGLKQVIYEPSRVYIGENKPQSALHKLEEIHLNFDSGVKWENDNFCYSSFREPIKFSPYLTCIIGGRGSGKSTLLNLLAEKIGQGKAFFSKVSEKDIKSKVKFIPEIIDNIEYLAQNEIEDFAKNSKKFTQAIFERLDKKTDSELSNLEKKITENLNIFQKQIELLQLRVEKHTEFLNKKNDLKKYENIIKTLNDVKYIENVSELQVTQKKLVLIENSRTQYKQLFDEVNTLIKNNIKITEAKNTFDEYYNEYIEDLEKLNVKYKSKNYESIKTEITTLKSNSEKIQKIISEYLKTKGMNEDNIKDAQNATSNIEIIKSSIAKLKKEIIDIKKQILKFNITDLNSDIEIFKIKIEEQLNIINESFNKISKQNPLEVKTIKVEYTLNKDVIEVVIDEFMQILTNFNIREKTTFKNYLKANLRLEEISSIRRGCEFLDTLNISNKNTQTYQVIEEVFGNQLYFEIYKLIIEKNLRDIKNNKVLKAYYNDKNLENSSFGQRCTAAIVILLSLGNHPIIIDEPEAHLDSSLIANYLVELIKQQKQQRQIVFATHNANFVLNADAELIIKLENTDGLTSSVSFSIEDLNHREDLLKLEGGREAFKKREQKYNI